VPPQTCQPELRFEFAKVLGVPMPTPNVLFDATLRCDGALLGEPIGECVPDNDEELEGFLETSLVFWDMNWVESSAKSEINDRVFQATRTWGNRVSRV
jgi:hypothetical protein